ncbi:hypothetical protein DERF_002114 [Dermatophagoides farinae]|uniref:Uncharacterized protein n=1 Tax=Dermatophagoides farinae TaxID=6954 RepID=A0A922LD77_DERFA|nr:hypothetical protein DERF_002114 [Dermatophagoides farinae]
MHYYIAATILLCHEAKKKCTRLSIDPGDLLLGFSTTHIIYNKKRDSPEFEMENRCDNCNERK